MRPPGPRGLPGRQSRVRWRWVSEAPRSHTARTRRASVPPRSCVRFPLGLIFPLRPPGPAARLPGLGGPQLPAPKARRPSHLHRGREPPSVSPDRQEPRPQPPRPRSSPRPPPGPAIAAVVSARRPLPRLAGPPAPTAPAPAPALTRDRVRSVMSCSKARVSSACRCVCSAIFSLNFRGLALPEPGEAAMARAPRERDRQTAGAGPRGSAHPLGPQAAPSRRPKPVLRHDPAEEPPRPQSQRAAGSAPRSAPTRRPRPRRRLSGLPAPKPDLRRADGALLPAVPRLPTPSHLHPVCKAKSRPRVSAAGYHCPRPQLRDGFRI